MYVRCLDNTVNAHRSELTVDGIYEVKEFNGWDDKPITLWVNGRPWHGGTYGFEEYHDPGAQELIDDYRKG